MAIIEYKGRRGSSFYVRVNGPEGNKFYGEPIREWECPGGKREARRLAKKREADILTGKAFRSSPLTADQYVERYLERVEKESLPSGRKRKRGTMLTLAYALQNFRRDFKGRRLERITRTEAINWSHDATAGELRAVKQLFNAAIDEELIERSPFRKISKPTQTRGKQAPPDPEQFESLLDACDVLGDYGPMFRAFLTFAGYTGMRPGELYALEWGDIDFEGMRVHVQRGLSNGVVDLPKSNHVREIVLVPPARDALLTLPRVSDYVFVNKQRGRLSGAVVHNYWSVVRAKVGLEKMTLYLATRHRFAHHLHVERNLPWRVVQEQLGHADDKLKDVYGHTDIGWQREIESAYGMNVRHLRPVERTVNE